ncbi:hypothetical protein ACQ5SO_05625 [Rhodovulum sp. DZ06]|uniref:hypothetical protein n=1 Tax=Rhodovulum sp. DZ06 TaxID=3425126 RepID=UPI003D33C8E7
MTEFHPKRLGARNTATFQGVAAAVLVAVAAVFHPFIYVFAAAMALGAVIALRRARDPRPLLRVTADGIWSRAGEARWDQVTGYGLAHFGSRRRGKTCFWVETAPGGPEFKDLHGDQMMADKHQLRIPADDFDTSNGDPLNAARAIRPDLEQKP